MAHALLSPSSASRWLTCTPSAVLESNFPNKETEAAAEGTLAHTLAEWMLQRKLGWITKLKYESELRKVQAFTWAPEEIIEVDGVYQVKKGAAKKLYQPEMLGYIEDYTGIVLEQFLTAQKSTQDAQIFLETKLDLRAWVPDGFGTGDVTIIADGVMYIRDLKYGKGVPVSAERNKQLMLYALGALAKHSYLYDITRVNMGIIQPRLDSITEYEISVAELMEWANTELKPKAAIAFKGEGDFVPGEHCRFCRAAPRCRANYDANMKIAELDFKDALLLTDAEVASVLKTGDLFVKYISTVKDYALHEAVANRKEWPGMKLVVGKSNRLYSDPLHVANILNHAGYMENVIYKPKELKGITDMTGLLGKATFETLLSACLVKPKGKLTLVPESDKRPAHNSADAAADAFKDVVTE